MDMKGMRKHIRFFIQFLFFISIILCSCASGPASNAVKIIPEHSGYTLEQMVIFSRHNLRAPLLSKDSVLGKMTPHDWPEMSVSSGELTTLGGLQENAMGSFFARYLADKGLMSEDWIPDDGQIRIYANSLQRTIATAQSFSEGLLPAAKAEVEYHMSVGQMDPVFCPCLTIADYSYIDRVSREVCQHIGCNTVAEIDAGLSGNYALLEKVLDFKDSDYAKEAGLSSLPIGKNMITYKAGEEPSMTGSLKLATNAADALTMQYYEQADDALVAFGKSLTFKEWQKIGDICTAYQTAMFGVPSVAYNVAHPLLMELRDELTADGRVFTMLCGHDSNVESLLVALEAEHFVIPDNISTKTPIGCKIVIEKWRGEDAALYATVSLVYQDSESLRHNKPITLDEPPSWIELSLQGLEKNKDGLYRFDDLLSRFDKAIAAYDTL